MRRVRPTGRLTLLSVGAVVPRKGYDVLVAALAQLADLPWRLSSWATARAVRDTRGRLDAEIARSACADRVDIAGAVAPERLAALYRAADLFVLPSRFEGYGMAYAEAIAHGAAGGRHRPPARSRRPCRPGAGVLVPPDDVEALAAALRRLIDEPAPSASALAAGARAAAASFPTWRESAALFAQRAGWCSHERIFRRMAGAARAL